MDEYFQQWILRPDPNVILFWENWLQQYPDQQPTVQKARQLVLLLASDKTTVTPQDVQRLKDTIDKRIGEQKVSKRTSNASNKYFYRVAASLAGLVCLMAVLYMTLHHTWEYATYTTDFGEIQKITLPDSSLVTLNANSKLYFAKSWDQHDSRKVWLEGEAYFDVTKVLVAPDTEKHRKFVVQVGQSQIEVLGTKFNVRHRHEAVEVVLSEGAVTLRAPINQQPEEITMKPGERVIYQQRDQTYSQSAVDTEVYESWKENRLIFKSTPLSEIIQLLEDTYGYEVILADSTMSETRITATVMASQPMTLLKLLEKLLTTEVQVNQKTVLIGKTE